MAGEFIPTIWSKQILLRLRAVLTAMAVTNQDYQGEIKEAGDTVKIHTPGTVTSKPYTPDVDIAAPETPTDIDTTLVIDQYNYFNFKINDILDVQSSVKRMKSYIDEAVYALRDTIETFIFGKYVNVAAANVVNPVGTGALLTINNIYTFFNEMFRKFNEANIPTEGRYVVIPPVVEEVMRAYFAGRSTDFGDKVSANGYIGDFAGFNIFQSNNVPLVVESLTGTGNQNVYKCLSGRKAGITFANQIPVDSIEHYRPEKRFENAVKGLSLYGAKVLRSGVSNGLMNFAVN
ncbi:MAG: P22 coat protein - protein 5 domain protein [archaeon]|nr:P22 coat protein - protein 5 domain protein [archaeon]